LLFFVDTSFSFGKSRISWAARRRKAGYWNIFFKVEVKERLNIKFKKYKLKGMIYAGTEINFSLYFLKNEEN